MKDKIEGVIIKTNLPVILLKGIIILPFNEIRLEFDNEISKNIIELSELFHNNRIMLVYDNSSSTNSLPMFGVASKIVKKVDLPNGKTRIIIRGEKRAKIKEYLNKDKVDEVLESIIEEVEDTKLDADMESALIRKLLSSFESAVNDIPYLSNSSIELIRNSNNLSMITDIISSSLPISLERMEEYLYECDMTKRASMIISDTIRERNLVNLEKNIDLKVKEEIDDSQKEYILREKIKFMKEELGESDNEIDELKKKIDDLSAPSKIKDRLYKELSKYENTNKMHPEASIIKNYIDWLLNLPWNVFTKDNDDLKSVRAYLDETHYDISDVKDRIIEYLAVKKMNNNLKSPIICLVGPPGVGKTSLAYSIAKALNRNFVKISVGGVSDECEIKGHRKAYIGSAPGRIISSMKKAKSSNPVFLIDEIDKMSNGINGDPRASLLEVLDIEQNKCFSDNYIEEEYDLSNVMFILTANYIEDIPSELKDRLEIINLEGYTIYEKMDIIKKHLIPKVLKENGLNDINITDEAIKSIIKYYTRESGVREVERLLGKIVRKIVTDIVLNDKDDSLVTVTDSDLIKYLGKKKYHYTNKISSSVGVVNALAYTPFGGDTLPIEVNYYKGDGKLVLTGSLGDVMKESAMIALSYLKNNYKYYNIDYDKLTNNDIHIHVLEGAIKKDGPSAGIALVTALISSLTNTRIRTNLAMTGEISLRGNVLPIGGLKEKAMGAHMKGIKDIIIPYDNLKDLDEVAKEIKNDIHFIPVKNYKEVMKYIWRNYD